MIVKRAKIFMLISLFSKNRILSFGSWKSERVITRAFEHSECWNLGLVWQYRRDLTKIILRERTCIESIEHTYVYWLNYCQWRWSITIKRIEAAIVLKSVRKLRAYVNCQALSVTHMTSYKNKFKIREYRRYFRSPSQSFFYTVIRLDGQPVAVRLCN